MKRQEFLKTLLVIIAFLGFLVIPSHLWAQGNSAAAFDRVKAVQEAHTDALMAKADVVGTAIGAGQGGQPIVLVLVERGNVPGIPTSLQGVPVRPLVTGKIYALPKPDKPGGGKGKGGGGGEPAVDPTGRFDRPVPIGVSTGHPDVTAGTIGCRVWGTDDTGTHFFALSNNHVYAHENQAHIGDAVIQPGTFDGGWSPKDDIGKLWVFAPINFSSGATNIIDAAIALTTIDYLGNATPSDGYGTPKSQTIAAQVNMTVIKYGRTTGQTKGRIQGINGVVNVRYESGVTLFTGQIVIGGGKFSSGGDSGSLIVVGKGADARRPVGLLFAGGSGATIANPIDAVLDYFGVTIDGE